MNQPAQPKPLRVHSPRGATATRIEWSNGQQMSFEHRTLRGLCPCAHCQGHEGPIRWVSGAEQLSKLGLELTNIEQVGHYALALAWADGHSGGIYTYPYLYALGALEGAPIEKLRAFRPSRG